ncbi:O-antigen ligase family protein [Falsiroseomonas oryzae]|uniref:O-antigen ligase family protein n=1 Tax=Falsiroseomonas oryzae TaxID=2766473 RepID=UPI0022EAFCD6|nr:O-antigen ligase family protein [Roseomonas sp. MO-31]
MRTVPPALLSALLALLVITALLLAAIAAPQLALALLPAAAALMIAMLFYEAPLLAVGLLVACYGLALDLQLDTLAERGGGSVGTLGAAVVKIIPFAIAAMLCLRFGFARAINWPFLAFTLVAVVSLVVLPIGRVSTFGEMLRSFVGSTAPFVLAFAAAPRPVWSALCKAVVLVPLVSALVGFLVWPTGFYQPFDHNWRFQGLHSPPFLAGFCVTAVFAATLEYLRGFRNRWLVLGGAALAVLLATQARAPLIAVGLFLLAIFLLADRRVFPLKRRLDLAMGGLLPAAVLLGPLLIFALDRFVGGDDFSKFSGRDVIWPYFLDAIENRPLFGYGLGAGKLIVDPEDPQIRLIRSNAAHNEYLRLSVDAGIVGCALIFLSLVVWVWAGTRGTRGADRLVLRCAVLAALIHSGFDNTLIASTAVIQFSWFAAALARARSERHDTGRHEALRAALARRAAGT